MSTVTAPLSENRAVSPGDVARYREGGHLYVPALLSPDEAAPFAPAIADATTRLAGEVAPLEERDTYGKAFLQVMNLWREDETVAEFVLAKRFASVAAALLGVECVRLYHDQALFKEPGGGYTPWHQDALYWPLDGHQCVTMWMPLVDIVPDMGALTFVTGSQLDGPQSDVTISDASEEHFESIIAERRYQLTTPRPMRAGDATFHSGWTVHRAGGNDTDVMRAVMTVIYFADGLRVTEPTNPSQENDLRAWLPGLRPGDVAATPANPVV